MNTFRLLLCSLAGFPIAGCATVSVFEPASSIEMSLAGPGSELRSNAETYCEKVREKGLATGESSLGALAGRLFGKADDAEVYWRRVGADRFPPATVLTHVRADASETANGLAELNGLARTLIADASPSKTDVNEFERALIHARQARDSLADAIHRANDRATRSYDPDVELKALDAGLTQASELADEMAAVRASGGGADGLLPST
ncbi:MAG: hypothetical protein R3C52_06340 [Hyphomonadaceae bacterium]